MKRKLSIALGAVASLMLVVGAFAYWTSSGTATGNGTAATADGASTTVTVSNVSGGSGLTPGGATNDVTVSLSTDGTHVNLSSATVSIESITGADGSCTAADYEVTSASPFSQAVTGTPVDDVVVGTVRMIDSGSNQDGCKNAVVNLKVDVS